MAKHERSGSLQFSKLCNNNSLDVPLEITSCLVAVLLISINAVVALTTQEHEPSVFVPPIDALCRAAVTVRTEAGVTPFEY